MKKFLVITAMLLSGATSFAGQLYCSSIQFKSPAAQAVEAKKMKGFTKLRLTSGDGGVRLQLLDMDRSVSLSRNMTKITNSVFTDDKLTAELKQTKQGEIEVEISNYRTGELFLRAIGCQK
jgi:hypothetical protein